MEFMRPFRIGLCLALLVLTLLGSSWPGLAQPAAPHSTGSPGAGDLIPRAFLPLAARFGATPPTSFELIDQAVATGRISAEQGLIYKVFAQFSDARLPVQYVGGGVGRQGDLITDEVVAQAATLSDSAKETLTPFFVPPNDPRSWYYLPRIGAAGLQASPSADQWLFKPAAGGKIRVFYWSADADAAAKATQIAAQFDAKIWSKLTTLMQKTPLPNASGTTDIYLWDSYIKNNGTVVAFDATTLGITVPAACDQTAVTIYLPNGLPIGSEASAGLLQYATHEFMHAIQFAHTIQSCSNYRWLKEATATWAEDYVYPQANSEQQTASGYLDRPQARLDDGSGLHDYGAYLLFYYLTHSVDTSARVVRYTWQNAATTGNSYQAMDNAVQQAAPGTMWHDVYWPLYLATLWNKAPFPQYYAPDGLTVTVAPDGGGSIPISTPSGEQVTPLYAELPTGGAVFYDLKFPDSSVRSVSILNGLGYKLSTGDATGAITYGVDGDETYLTEELPPEDLQGVTAELLLKAAGQDAKPGPQALTYPLASLPEFGHCMDLQGPMEEIVVILSNGDFAHPDRILKAADLPVTVWANNVPCWQVTGTASATDHDDDGMSYTVQGSVTFGWPSQLPVPDTYQNVAYMLFPETPLAMLSAQAHWTVSAGSHSDCGYSGEGDYTATEEAGDLLTLEQGLTPGSPTYRGYQGNAGADPGTTGSYTVTCPWGTFTEDWSDGPPDFLDIPLGDVEDCGPIRVGADGSMSGSCKLPNYEGRWQEYTWDLHGVKK
jgi:hypothetical protein